jgi:hypothetical protein
MAAVGIYLNEAGHRALFSAGEVGRVRGRDDRSCGALSWGPLALHQGAAHLAVRHRGGRAFQRLEVGGPRRIDGSRILEELFVEVFHETGIGAG